MGDLLKKGDVFKLKQAEPCGSVVAEYLAGKYIVLCVADRDWYGSSSWKYKTKKRQVFCESLEPKGTKISFFQSDEDLRIFGLKISGRPTQDLEIDLLEEEKAAAKENYSVEWATTEKMGNKKTNDFDYAEIMKDAIDSVVKDAIESTAHRIIKDFKEGIKKVIGN